MMKTLYSVVLANMMIAGTALTNAAWAAPICLRTQDMTETQPQKGGASIIFTMRDGSTWRNDLRGRCPDLWFTGFAWTVRNGDGTVCENQDTLHVLRSAEICALGKFTQLTPSHAQQHTQR